MKIKEKKKEYTKEIKKCETEFGDGCAYYTSTNLVLRSGGE